MRRAVRLLVGAALLAPSAAAHDGPPYPLLVDEELSGHTLSVWADPDVGVGTFYVYFDEEPGAVDAELDVAVCPSDGRLPEVVHSAVPAEPNEPFQWVAEVDFDRRGDWDVRFVLSAEGRREEIAMPVDVTPPGAGRIDLLWFLFPFAAVGFLWIKVVLKRRELARPSPT